MKTVSLRSNCRATPVTSMYGFTLWRLLRAKDPRDHLYRQLKNA